MRWTEEEYQALLRSREIASQRTKASKFRSQKTTVADETFDSKHESQYGHELRLREQAGEVRNVQRQVEFALVVNDLLVTTYRADFVFEERHGDAWERVVADAKSERTRTLEAYRIKFKLMRALLNIEIREILNRPWKKRHK